MYFSLESILLTVPSFHFFLPVTVRIPSLSRCLQIPEMLIPSRYSRKMSRTTSASSGTITSSPFSFFVYPINLLWFTMSVPLSNLLAMPQRVFSLRFRLSSCAWLPSIVTSISPVLSSVLICSFSKYTAIFLARSSRIVFSKSAVFRAKRLMDFVSTRSTFPASQSCSKRLNSSRFRMSVPLIPSSA